ncbi:uncharacterized protein LOC134192386 [Corticium candelabrum]|uniref:uncharacterized protein LOC134192386 n=1 Tax=Corticium candelabrum TaxID=121492 RepID=UPI002E2561FD|nr:uncharacterized protein LOC134192386 [Corticium candelabrum]
MARLYVGGLRDSLTRDDIEVTFRPYGAIKDVWIARNPPGFAFVEFEQKSDADKAIAALNNREVLGCTLKVQVASNKPKPGDRRPPTGRRSPPYRSRGYYEERFDRYAYPPPHPYGHPLDYYDYYNKYYGRPPPPPPRMYDRMYDRYYERDYYGYDRRYPGNSRPASGPPARDAQASQSATAGEGAAQSQPPSSAYQVAQGGTGYAAPSYSAEATSYSTSVTPYDPTSNIGPPGTDLRMSAQAHGEMLSSQRAGSRSPLGDHHYPTMADPTA